MAIFNVQQIVRNWSIPKLGFVSALVFTQFSRTHKNSPVLHSCPSNNKRCRRERRPGLTLVELLAALTLSAMIMAVLLGLVTKLSLARDILKDEKPFEPWKTILKQQLQRDYIGCRSILLTSRRIRMDGYADFVDSFGIRRSGPCSIEYYIVSDEGESWMFREQRDLLASPPDNVRRELVCRSISKFRSLDDLSTDVAPGVLRIELTQTAEIPVNEIGSSSVQHPSSTMTISVVLLRHGADQ